MKITFVADEFAKVLRDMVRIIPSATNRPVLKHVLITATKEDDRVDVYASSEDISVRRTIYQEIMSPSVIIERGGSCLLPAKELYEIVKKATDNITLDVKVDKTELVFGKTKYELAGLDPKMFTPYSNDSDASTTATISAPELHRLLKRTTYSTAKGEQRPILTGVNLILTESTLRAVGTDGLRLAEYPVTCKSVEGEPRNLVVPSSLLDKLATALPAHDDDELVTLVIGPTSVIVAWSDDGHRMIMRGLEGTFPDTSQIIPKNPPHKVVIDREVLLGACERVSILGESENSRVQFDFSPTHVVLTAASSQYGYARDVVGVKDAPEDKSLSLWCNITYWINLLKSLEGVNFIEIGLTGANKPFTIKPVGGVGLSLIAPLAGVAAPQKDESDNDEETIGA